MMITTTITDRRPTTDRQGRQSNQNLCRPVRSGLPPGQARSDKLKTRLINETGFSISSGSVDNFSICHGYDSVGLGSVLGIVGDHHDGKAIVFKVCEQVHD